MGYSKSLKTLEDAIPLIKPLLKGKPCQWTVRPSEQERTLYKIREALRIAFRNKARYPEYARAYSTFRFRLVGNSEIHAIPYRPKDTPVIAVVVDGDEVVPEQIEFAIPLERERELVEVWAQPEPLRVTEVEHIPTRAEVAGPQTRFSVIQAWTDRDGAATLHFPDAALTVDDLTSVYRWAKLQLPEVMLLVDPPQPALTLGFLISEMEEFQWKPEGE